jgi:hypothetical protein
MTGMQMPIPLGRWFNGVLPPAKLVEVKSLSIRQLRPLLLTFSIAPPCAFRLPPVYFRLRILTNFIPSPSFGRPRVATTIHKSERPFRPTPQHPLRFRQLRLLESGSNVVDRRFVEDSLIAKANAKRTAGLIVQMVE